MLATDNLKQLQKELINKATNKIRNKMASAAHTAALKQESIQMHIEAIKVPLSELQTQLLILPDDSTEKKNVEDLVRYFENTLEGLEYRFNKVEAEYLESMDLVIRVSEPYGALSKDQLDAMLLSTNTVNYGLINTPLGVATVSNP